MALSKSRIKFYRSLHQPESRREDGLFLVEGFNLLREALQEHWALSEVLLKAELAASERSAPLLKQIAEASIPLLYCSDSELQRVCEAKSPQGVVALARLPEPLALHADPPPDVLLICECVSDPSNLGALLRVADWFGIGAVVLGAGSAEPFSPKAVRASAGSIFRVPTVCVPDLAELIQHEKSAGRQLFAALLHAELTPQQLPNQGLRGLVVGHEKRGVSDPIAALCAASVGIPGRGRAESLNLAVAAGILLYQLTGSAEP